MSKAILSVFSGNLFGKIVGVLREIILSYFYGTGAIIGSFRVSQAATFVAINFFTSDILNSGFIPLYKNYLAESKSKALDLFWTLHTLLFLLSLFISFTLFIFSNEIVSLLAPGLSKKELQLANEFLRVLSGTVPFYVLSALYANLAVANGAYLLISLRPVVQSIGLIIGAVGAYFFDKVLLMAWSVLLSFSTFWCYSLYYTHKRMFLGKLKFWKIEPAVRFWRVVRPLLPLPIFLQGNIVIEKMVASYLGIEVIASLEYAKFITETGMVLVAIPIGYVGLSKMSGLTKKKTALFLRKVVPFVFLVTVPISAFLFAHPDWIVKVLFSRGAFDAQSVSITSSIVRGLAIGFWAQVLSYIFIKALNANLKNHIALAVMMAALAINALLNISLYKYLGVITLGISVSLYGISMLVFSVLYYNLGKFVFSSLLPLIFFAMVYIAVDFLLLDDLSRILIPIFFLVFWIVGLSIVPQYRCLFKKYLSMILK